MTEAKRPVIVIGAGGQARVVSSILARSDRFEVVGFLDYVSTTAGEQIGEKTVLGDHSLLPDLLAQGVKHAIVAVGDNAIRTKHFNTLTQMGFELINVIHPTALIEDGATLGCGNVVAAGAIICCYTQIGDNCIINTGAIVEHETRVGSNVHIAPGVNIAGRVKIGSNTFVGIGVTVKEYLTLGENATVGAGAVVLKDIPANVIAYGVPAEIRREKE